MTQTKSILITGASRGFGRLWAEAAVSRGHNVIAAVRDTQTVADLSERHGKKFLALQHDVTDRENAFRVVQSAEDRFEKIDVLINNAGYCLAGALEEVSERDARAMFDTNLFGALWMSQALLPVMRRQKSGHIITVSSVSGLMGQPTISMYNTSKWALEGMMESLHQEVTDLGISVTIVEPTIFATEFKSAASLRLSNPIGAYDAARAKLRASLANEPVNDPRSSVEPIMDLIDASAPPLRLLLGDTGLHWAVKSYGEKLAGWAAH
ncbi:SDR family NAD(P)-dependent oxidoreductase [Rhizobium sp. 2MFCol3.1]|uniref:SDR family NAD(P)-dependent oxidoreductase n=1 Tax=Rhizobium sp. 2MFCol3.1 TaxID=1246459 RepID=UPI000365773B|nr:SDR family NAD(P)-dependent oxidoreductase [Rhizobium sp. 2MFCol3.1]